VKLNQLDASQGPKMHVVKGFSDVFFEELSVMPPDHDIKFVIELVFGTASMYKTPYRMATKQLAELTMDSKRAKQSSKDSPGF
jgi:hypothetical protein